MNKTIFFYPRRKDTKWAVAYPEKVRGVYIEQIKLTCSSYTEALRIASDLNAECAAHPIQEGGRRKTGQGRLH